MSPITTIDGTSIYYDQAADDQQDIPEVADSFDRCRETVIVAGDN